MTHAIGVDVGTTNVKVALVDRAGESIAAAKRQLAPSPSSETEQDADELWAQVCDAVREVTSAAPGAASDVAVIGVCSQYSSIVPVDASGEPVADIVMWTDHRGSDHSWAILGAHDEAFEVWLEHHGIPPVGGGLSLAHILHLQLDRPDVHAATAAYLEVMDYVTTRLTGRITATQHSMFMSQVCDTRDLGSTVYDTDLIELAGIDVGRLPPLIGVDEAVGTVRPEVADELGLPGGVVVYAGTNDTATGLVATGAVVAGRAGLSIGTTSVLIDTVARKDTDIDHEILSMPGVFEGSYLVFAENGLGGKAMEHVLANLVYAADALADHITDDDFEELDAALDSVPPGSQGVLFLPWLGGSLSPSADTRMRGGFLNLSLESTRTQLVRAVAEGVAFNLAWLLPYVETFTGNEIDEIVFNGGAARSRAWCQIIADALDRPVTPVVEPERAVARATALLSLHRHGDLSIDDLTGSVQLGERFEPLPDNRSVYDRMKTQFIAAYEATQPIHHALNE